MRSRTMVMIAAALAVLLAACGSGGGSGSAGSESPIWKATASPPAPVVAPRDTPTGEPADSNGKQSGAEPLDVPIGLVMRSVAEGEIEFLNQRLLPDDLVLRLMFRDEVDLEILDQITASQKGLGLRASFEGDPSPLLALAKAKGITVVAYDLEGHLGLSAEETLAREETMYNAVRQQNLTFMFGTRQRLIERYYQKFASYTDVLVVQAQHYQTLADYKVIVTDLVAAIRQARPGLKVWVQVSVNPVENPQITAQEVLEDIYQIADIADGIFIYYEPERWEVARQVIEQIRPSPRTATPGKNVSSLCQRPPARPRQKTRGCLSNAQSVHGSTCLVD